MKLVRWEFQGLHVPMMEDDQGELYCTSKAICGALSLETDTLDKLVSRHREEFSDLRLTDCQAKEFFQRHRAEFGIQRVRADMRLWSEDDMLTFAFHAHTPASLEFRKKLRVFIKAHACKSYVTQTQFEALQLENEAVKADLACIRAVLADALPHASNAASLAGKMLREQAGTKRLRVVYAN